MKIFKTFNFTPHNSKLYEIAFTHTSFSNENINVESYERLEFLGDAILEFIISEYLYKEKHLSEGEMTKIRQRYVCEEACATYAKDLQFGLDIKLGGSEGDNTPNDTILADVFEAFIAATYLDQGISFTKNLVLNIITTYIDKKVDFLHDYKSTLQELVQTDKKSLEYEVIRESGPSHNKTFVSQVKIDGIVLGEGIGSSKKQSEQRAAKMALDKQAK